MSQQDISMILSELKEIKDQVKLTNGRVTRLERVLLILFGIAVGMGVLKLGAVGIGL
jgi:hypothetical protein